MGGRQNATGAVALDEAYLTRVARVESLPQSQSGADKTWVWLLIEADRVFRSRLRPLESVDPVATLLRALHDRVIRYVVIGVSGAN